VQSSLLDLFVFTVIGIEVLSISKIT